MEQARLEEIGTIPLAKETHKTLADGACVMELVSYVAGETWSDAPGCVSPCIAAALRSWNDAMNDEDRQMLKPLIPCVIGTVNPALEEQRAYIAIDWFVRVACPGWLALAKLDACATALRVLPDITCLQALNMAYEDLSAAWSAARSAAWSAAEQVLRPTVVELQRSALVMVERMIAVGGAP